MNSISVTILCLLLLGICCFKTDAATTSEHIGGWSDWKCDRNGDTCFRRRTCSSTIDFVCPNKTEVALTSCPCVEDLSSVSGHDGGWSDWRCQQTSDKCFKVRTCNSTNDFNCPQKSEAVYTTCPCDAEWSQWGNWACTQNPDVCLNIRQRSCIRGFKENSCSDLHGKNFETVQCDSDKPCNNSLSVSSHTGLWSNWRCEQDDKHCFKIRTCNSTIDFNCPKKSEVNITTCPCVAEWSPWGKWTCTQSENICLNIRQRNCVSGFADKTCKTLPGKDFEAVPCENNITCKITSTTPTTQVVPTSTMSITTTTEIPFVITDATTTTVSVSSGSKKPSPTTEATTNISMASTISSQKSTSTSAATTSMSKPSSTQPNQMNKNTSSVSGHNIGWSDWRCEQIVDNCFKIRTCNSTIDFNCPQNSEVVITTCPCDAEWSPWGKWTCTQSGNICLNIRQRSCISGFTDQTCSTLPGKDFETVPCANNMTCTITNTTPTTQVVSTSTKAITTTTQKPFNLPDATATTAAVSLGSKSSPTTDATTNIFMVSTISSQKPASTPAATSMSTPSSTQLEPTPSTPTTASLTMTLHQTTISTSTSSSNPLSSSKPTIESSFTYIYWFEWTGWECKNVTICLMSRTRNCSTYNPADCEKKLGGEHFHVEPCKKEICPVTWLEWSSWTCRIEKGGSCNKTRSRKCSTGSDAQCGFDSLQREQCDDVTCPELTKLGKLGYCKDLDNSKCSDADSCENQSILLMCLADAHVASKICPKACGCCHVDPEWSRWSNWTCERTNTMCRMKQSRTCSTGNTTDCEGISVREAVCDERLCPEPTWESWSRWECQLRPNNTCTMSRSRKCSNEDFCMGNTQEEDDCSSKECPDFVEFKVDCSLHNTKSDACVDGAGCHFFKNTPKTLCVDDAAACPVTCGCCIISSVGTITPTPSSGNSSNGTSSGVTTNNHIGVATHNPSGSGENGSNGTGSGVTTNKPIGLTTQNPSGSGGNGSNGTGSGVTTNNPTGLTIQNPSGSGGNGSNGTGSGITTNNPFGLTTQNPSGSGGDGSNGTGSGVTTNNPIGVTTQNPSGSGGNGSNGTGSEVITNNPISETTHNPSGSGGNGSNGTVSGVTTNNPIGVITQSPSGSGGNGSNETGSGVTTNNPTGVTTQNSSGSGGNGSNVTGSGVTTNDPIGVITQNPSGSSGNGSNGTDSGVTTNKPIGVTTQNPSGSGGNGSNGTGSGVTTNNPIGITTQNPFGSGVNGSNGTGSGVTTNNPIGVITQNPSGSGGNGSNGTGSGVTTNNPIGVITQNPSGSGGNSSNGTGSGVTTNNPIGVITQNPSGSGGNSSNGTGSVVTTNNPIGVITQNPSGSGGNVSNGTGLGITTNNPVGTTTLNPSGSGAPISVITQNPSGSGGNGSNETGSGVSTNSQTVAPTPSTTKTTTTTQKQPHTPTPAAVTCNVCAGPEFLCEKLFAPQTCSPPNNYCINKLTNHIDGTRMVTRHCGNFDTCYREWFLGSSDSDKCRNFEDNNIITLDFDCTYCCTSDNCNKPIKPLDKDLYKDL